MRSVPTGFALLPAVIGLVVLAAMVVMMRQQGTEIARTSTAALEETQVQELLRTAELRARLELDAKNCGGFESRKATLGGHSYSVGFSAVEGSPVDFTLRAAVSGAVERTRHMLQQTAWDGEQTLQIVSSTSTYVSQFKPSDTHATHQHLKVGGNAGKDHRSLVKFDLSSIPADARLASATLKLNVESVGDSNRQVEVRRLTEDWDEAVTHWTRRGTLLLDDVKWADAGATHAATEYGSFVVTSNGPVSVDVSALVELWRTGEVPNQGLLLRQEKGPLGLETNFSSDDSSVGNVILEVRYRCECGSTCSVDNYASCDAKYRANTVTSVHAPGIGDIEGMAAVPADFTLAGITFGSDGGYVLTDGTALHGYSTSGVLRGSCSLTTNASGLAYISAGPDRERLAVMRSVSPPNIVYVGPTCAIQRTVVPTGSTLANPVGIAYLRLEQGHQREHQLAMVNATGSIEFVDTAGAVRGLVNMDFAPGSVADVTHVYNQEYLLVLDTQRSEVVTLDLAGHVEDRYDYGRFTLTNAHAMTADMNSCAHIIGSQSSNRVVSLIRTPQTIEPIAHWKLDSPSGGTAMDFVGTNHATLAGSPTWSPLAGALQGALVFAGGGESAMVADSANLNLVDSFTLSGWIKPTLHDAGEPVVSKRVALNEHQYWLGTVSGQATFRYNNGSENVLAGGAGLAVNSWNHLAAAVDLGAGDVKLFVNGAQVTTAPITGPVRSTSALVRLGGDGIDDTHAAIDDVRIYNGALTPADVLALYQESPAATLGGGPPPAPSCNNQDYADNFGSVSYALSTGSLSWPDAWVEIGETDGPNAGDVRVQVAPQALQVQDNKNGGKGVMRKVDLSRFTSVALSFDYARYDLEADDYVTISIGDGSAGGWVELGRIQGPGTDNTSSMLQMSFDVSAHRHAGRYISFLTYPSMGATEGAYIDNVRLSGCYL